MFNLSTIQLEKKSVFFINSFLILLIVFFIYYEINIKYFFYFNIFITLFLSYIFFKRSKKLSKFLIVTNMFIFFYFLYPQIASYLNLLLREDAYLFILFYNLFIAFIFLVFSSEHKTFLKNVKNFDIRVFGVVIILGLTFGVLFYLVKEPIPISLLSGLGFQQYFMKALFFTFVLALSEQMIFSGFLFNVYKELTGKKDSFFQVSAIFVLFHMLRFEKLVVSYFQNFHMNFLYMIFAYYVLLFAFMLTALYLYTFKSKKHSGSFIYPVMLHFITDFSMLALIGIYG